MRLKAKFDNLFTVPGEQQNLSTKLFSSEGFFWLVTSATTGFALEEMYEYLGEENASIREKVTQATHALQQAIGRGTVEMAEQETARKQAVENLHTLREFVNQNCLIFNYTFVTVLAKTIATYWLTNKLIELEFQTVLSEEESRSVYMFLDTVINDHEEIEIIEDKLEKGQELSLDEKVYLRGSWQRGLFFWSRMYQEVFLLSEKVIPFHRQSS